MARNQKIIQEMKTVQIASYPGKDNERMPMLEKTINSLIGQVDIVRVMLNNYSSVPDWQFDNFERVGAVQSYLLDNSLGDAAKFYPGYQDGYLFTCDDDLIYPPDYIETMIEAIDKFDCIVSMHGRKMKSRPVKNSYTSRMETYHLLEKVNGYHIIDIAGTGVMGFHTSKFVPQISRMKFRNMADIWIAKLAYEKKVSLMVCPHQEGWIKYQNPTETIWDSRAATVKLQTAVYNSIGKPTDY